MSRDWPVPVVFAVCAVLVALLLLAVDQGRAFLCNVNGQQAHSYCPAYSEEPAP